MPAETVEVPSLGADHIVSLAEITVFPIPLSGLPTIGAYTALGCVKSHKIDYPSDTIKDIPCGLDPAAWTKPGMRQQGELTLTLLDFPTLSTDIMAFLDKRCVVKIESNDEDGALARTVTAIDWIPKLSMDSAEGEAESVVTASSKFRRHIVTFA